MGIYFTIINSARKVKIFHYLLLAAIVVVLFIINKDVFYEEILNKTIRNYDFKDLTENNGTFRSKKCPNKFKLLKLQHLDEAYDDVIVERHPNLPKFLTKPITLSSSIPDIPSIRWTGSVFQESWKNSPKFLLYSAHFDTRLNSHLFIHILALYDGETELQLPESQYYCQMWFNTKETPTVVPIYDALLLDYLTFGHNRLNPYVLSCQVPEPENGTSSFPVAVSLVEEICQRPTNVLKISSSPIKKKEESLDKDIKVGVCGKALFYYNEDFSTRLVEWIEIVKILGVSKIFFYRTKCHNNIQKVLDFYENEGTVKLVTFNYPPPYDQEGTFLRLWSKTKKTAYRAAQNIYITDCLQRNKDDFDYLAVFDVDEIPILKQHHTIQELLKSLRKLSNRIPESYFFKWKTFFRDLHSTTSPLNETDRSYCFSHNIRTKLTSRKASVFETNGKTFHDTNQVVWAHPHQHMIKNSELAPKARLKVLSRGLAYMGHFSDHTCERKEYCFDGNTEEETALLPIREKVVQEIKKVLDILQI